MSDNWVDCRDCLYDCSESVVPSVVLRNAPYCGILIIDAQLRELEASGK